MSIKIMLWYDVEDYVNPMADDALLLLLEMMDDLGIRSSLKMVAEKVRVLRERGRDDIFYRMAGHEICYHTKDHSRHPTSTEYCEDLNFKDGAEKFREVEQTGYDYVRDITGQAVTSYGQPGASWAPQVLPVIRKWGIPSYLDSHDIIDLDGGAFRYGGVLMFTRLWRTMRFDHDNPDSDAAMETAKEKFGKLTQGDEKTKLISIYYHPCEFSCEQFWDGVNFNKGKNNETMLPSPLRTPAEMKRRIENLKKFLAYTLTCPGVEYITASESLKYEHYRPEPITDADMRSYAAAFDGNVTFYPVKGEYLCASELFSLLYKAILKKPLAPRLLYGCEENTPSVIKTPKVSAKELAYAAENRYDLVFGYKQLKSLYQIGDNYLNPLDMFATMAYAVKTQQDTVPVRTGKLAAEKYVNLNDNYDNNWLFAEHFRIPNIIKHTQLQTWTLKPAVF
ncbi:MAG: hypothetical protein PHZ09_08730 [Eubacteriales bacterium]|nr:hypothetical protein [Eubacteriales bacterium]